MKKDKMRLSTTILTTVIFLLFLDYSLCFSEDLSPMGAMVFMPSVSFETDNNTFANAIDLNLVIAFINFGLSYRKWHEDISSLDSDHMYSDEVDGYIGLGFFNVLQVQYGWCKPINESHVTNVVRIRSDLTFWGDNNTTSWGFGFSDADHKWWIFRKGLIVSPSFEFSPSDTDKRKIFTLGIGVHF